MTGQDESYLRYFANRVNALYGVAEPCFHED